MTIVPSLRFKKDLKNLLGKDGGYQRKTAKCLWLLNENINHPSLRLHKLVGTEIYSVSVDMKIRILIQVNGQEIYLLRVGTHDEVY